MSRERASMPRFKYTSRFVSVNCITFNISTCDPQVRVMCNINWRMNCSCRVFWKRSSSLRFKCPPFPLRVQPIVSLDFCLQLSSSWQKNFLVITVGWHWHWHAHRPHWHAWNVDFTCLMFSHWTLQNVTCVPASRTDRVWCRLCSDICNSSWVHFCCYFVSIVCLRSGVTWLPLI